MLKKLFEKYKLDKNNKIFICTAVLGIVLLLLSGSFSSGEKQKEITPLKFDVNEYKITLEKEISDIIKSLNGVDIVKVMLTFSDNGKTEYLSEEKVSLENNGETENQDRESTAAFKRENGDEAPVVVRELLPEVKGVAVVVSGEYSRELEIKILNSVKGALGIGSNRISIVINERNE